VEGVLAVSEGLPLVVELLLIDDGSTDSTAKVMEDLCREYSACRMKVNAENRGLGRSVRDAYDGIEPGSWVTVVPGDDEFLFDSIQEFLAVRDRYDLILGYLQNPVIRSMRRRMASRLFNLVVGWLYGFNFRYLNGMKMYRAWVFQGIQIKSSGHAYVAELLAKAILRVPRLRIGEVPFAARGRATGSSKAIQPLSLWKALKDVWVGKVSVNSYRAEVIRSGTD